MLSTSLKPAQQVFELNWIPDPIVWHNFKDALTSAPFDTYFKNTLIITTLATLGAVVSSSLVAYSFARLRWPGRDLWFLLVLGTMMLPGIVTLIPQYILFAKLGWVNTFKPLIVPAWLASDAFYVFLLRQFFRGIPMELSEAAKIDGASELRIWWQIVTPLSRPALAAVTIFAFNGTWGDYLKPLIYLSTEHKYTLQLGLTTFQQAAGGLPRWDWMMAASLVVMLPVVIIFFAFQKYFIEGIAMTGIKR
jgi:ABC-type glycerol-3-phosphate transport system permease component